ncbi:His Kinase A (phospho-acceptor) domain-containing protein [Natronoarchaeum philippinense]|uniref:histidine kinase n=1 Tax=Natronoarchaeum philippinense TaxID=558529 RepID=A0A285NAZ3_NATPI|nr:HAMP domain-containing sensor histidine kinase [Natronoarchaeum philippinense]SNZ05136.1 His Kinase A (phospho-acceptor) domain-containing protein [Natronoarchaeum philippinense]
MVEIQLLFADDGNRNALASVVEEHHTAITDLEFRQCDMYVVDEAVFPTYRDDIEARKHSQEPVFCPVVLVRRDRTPITVTLPDPATRDPPHLVNAVVEAPIQKQTLFRTFTNLLSRRDQSEALTEELRERNERLEQFASTLRHELRNPLNILDGYLDQATERSDDHFFEICRDATDQMMQLLEDTLLLIDGGEVSTDPRPLDLSAVSDGCWNVVTADGADIEIRTSKQILADEVRLKQLLENLFRNAVEHAGPDVTVTVGDVEGGFYVEDDGTGIPTEERNRVFDEGYSVASAGTGLGLAVVQAVVDGHEWEVSLTDSTSGGARFEITGVRPYPAAQ